MSSRLSLHFPYQEESGLNDQEALDVYQQCLGELLLVLAGKYTPLSLTFFGQRISNRQHFILSRLQCSFAVCSLCVRLPVKTDACFCSSKQESKTVLIRNYD